MNVKTVQNVYRLVQAMNANAEMMDILENIASIVNIFFQLII